MDEKKKKKDRNINTGFLEKRVLDYPKGWMSQGKGGIGGRKKGDKENLLGVHRKRGAKVGNRGKGRHSNS